MASYRWLINKVNRDGKVCIQYLICIVSTADMILIKHNMIVQCILAQKSSVVKYKKYHKFLKAQLRHFLSRITN